MRNRLITASMTSHGNETAIPLAWPDELERPRGPEVCNIYIVIVRIFITSV